MDEDRSRRLPRQHPLLCYFLIAYAFTWLLVMPIVLETHHVADFHMPRAIHYLAVMGPAFSAVVITWLIGGHAGLRELGSRIIRWRVGRKWLLISIGSPIAMFAAAAVVSRGVDGAWVNLWDLGKVNFLPGLGPAVLLLWFISNGIGEEVGWRGFALPRLQERHHALVATVILAVFWAAWHLPFFFYLPTYREMGVAGAPGFFLSLVAGAILLTWLYNSSGGSLLMVAIWHAMFNFFTASTATTATIATVFSIEVMILAVLLIVVDRPANLSIRPRQVIHTRGAEPA